MSNFSLQNLMSPIVRVWELPEPEPREWVVANLIPCEATTILYGDGGTKKSYLALYLATQALRNCARMEAQRVRKSATAFAPRATNSLRYHLLSETRHRLLGLANQVLSQLSYRP